MSKTSTGFNTEFILGKLVDKATHFSSHSGEVGEGGIFVALKGDTSDGHQYLRQVLDKKILAALVERDMGIEDQRIITVGDTCQAHWHLASLMRKKLKIPVVGIGGSNGKTSTKDFLFQLLSKDYKCVRTEKSQNGKLGIPKTLEKLRPGVDVAIIEIGTDAPGDMERNVSLVDPSLAALTSIGEEHLNLLGDLEGVFEEERFLADYVLDKRGKVFCPSADPYLVKLAQRGAVLTPGSATEINPEFKSPIHSSQAQQNLALAVSIAMEIGLDHKKISEALKEINLPDGRGNLWEINKNLLILRDHYNANPSSMRASITTAAELARAKKLPLRLILGDMRDLGAGSLFQHARVLQAALAASPDYLLCVGEDFTKVSAPHVSTKLSVMAGSTELLRPMLFEEFKKPGVVLVKASRGTQIEQVMERLYGKFA